MAYQLPDAIPPAQLPVPGIGSVAGPVIGAAASIGGGFLSNMFNTQQRKGGEAFQREFAQNALSWRVADAKRAGIHPLFALGANVSSGQPVVVGDQVGPAIAEAGQSVGKLMDKVSANDQFAMKQMEYNMLEAQTQEARQRAYSTQLDNMQKEKLLNQGPSGVGPMDLGAYMKGLQETGQDPQQSSPGYVNQLDVKPRELTQMLKGFPGVVPGLDQGMEQIWLPNPGGEALPFLIPIMKGESWQEHLSELSYARFYGIMALNAKVYGTGWMREFEDYYLKGKLPKGKYQPIGPGYKSPGQGSDQNLVDFLIDRVYRESRKK